MIKSQVLQSVLMVVAVSACLQGALAQSDSSQEADTSGVKPWTLNITGGLMVSDDFPLSLIDLDLEGDPRNMKSIYGGLMMSQNFGSLFQAQIGASYARRGAHYDAKNAQLVNQFLDGQLALMLGSTDGRIGPVLSYNHLISSTYIQKNGNDIASRTDMDTTISPLALGLRGEIKMQEGSYLTAGVHWRLDEPSFSHFNVGLRLDMDRKRVNQRKDVRVFEKSEGERHIKTLKKGVLLVRLQTLDNSVLALRKSNQPQAADDLEDAIRVQNIAVMNAFKTAFDFCEVYFFYSYDSEAVRAGNYTQSLYTSDQTKAEVFELDSATTYIAEFGQLEQDTTELFSHYDWVSNGNFSGEKKAVYTYPASFQFSAIKIKGPDYYQLRRPFPYYVKTYGTFIFKRSPFDIIGQLNTNLWTYYEKCLPIAP